MLDILAGLLVASAVSGVVPVVNAELLVVSAAVALPALGVPIVALVSTIGQMCTKTSLFAVARWAPSRLPTKGREAIDRMRSRLERREGGVGSLVLLSAATGIPPFYGVSLATGALGMRLSSFVLAGSLGRLVRFGVLAALGRKVGARALDALALTQSLGPFLGG
jgi:membrane protein YqaA with SNARE-associated domain